MVRDSVRVFAEAMEVKLQRDDNSKSAWETELSMALLDGLMAEVSELREAFLRYHATADDPDGVALMAECCDVANYPMMIFSQLHPLTRHNRRGHPIHAVPRIESENHLVWEQKHRKEHER